jgi:hypothetical protein
MATGLANARPAAAREESQKLPTQTLSPNAVVKQGVEYESDTENAVQNDALSGHTQV